jgi:excinuclease ABC subunit C
MPKKPPLYSHLPSSPGVYLMKDKTGVVLYVGKSRNILSRVRTYFDESDRLNRAKQNMVKHIRAIETIETKNEVEALILETNLIKHLHPKYNVLMKDDKNMAYIRITDDPVPEVVKTRRREGGGEFFGPFPSDANLGALIEMGRKIFHLRSCRVVFGYK